MGEKCRALRTYWATVFYNQRISGEEENFFIFGKRVEDVERLDQKG